MSEELIPCPFCGSNNLSIETNSVQPDNFHDAWVHCDDCDAEGRHAMTVDGWLSSKEEAREEAITAWNRRSAPVPAAEGGELPPMPILPDTLLGWISDYGLARTDGVSEVERIHRREQLVKHIKVYASDYARFAIAASRAQQPAQGEAERDCRRCRSYSAVVKSKETQLAHAQAEARKNVEAVATLASEREANAILTAEVEALRNQLEVARAAASTSGAARVLDIDQQDSAQVGALASAAVDCTCPSGGGSLRWPCPVHPSSEAAQYQVEIGGDGYFAGCKIMVDASLPPDTVEMRGLNRVLLNLKTGEMTEFASKPAPAGAAKGPTHSAELPK